MFFKMLVSVLPSLGFRFVGDELPTMEGVAVFIHDALSGEAHKIAAAFREVALVIVPPGHQINSHVHEGNAVMIPLFGSARTLDGEDAHFGAIIKFEGAKPHGFQNVGSNGLVFLSLNEGISLGRGQPDVRAA